MAYNVMTTEGTFYKLCTTEGLLKNLGTKGWSTNGM